MLPILFVKKRKKTDGKLLRFVTFEQNRKTDRNQEKAHKHFLIHKIIIASIIILIRNNNLFDSKQLKWIDGLFFR